MEVARSTVRWPLVLALTAGCAANDGDGSGGGSSTGESSGGSEGAGDTGDVTGDEGADATDSSGGNDSTGTDSTGGGGLGQCPFDTELIFDPLGATLQLQGGGYCVRIERTDEGGTDVGHTQWALREMWVGPPGDVAHVDDGGSLCWHSSHHNRLDYAHAWTGSVHYDLLLKWDRDDVRTYTLQAFEHGPIDPAKACPPLPEGTGPIGESVDLSPLNP